MPRAFLVKKNKTPRSPAGEKRSFPDVDYDPNFNYVDNRIFANSSAVAGIIHSPTESDKFPVLSSLTSMFTSTVTAASCTSAFKPFKVEKENAPKRHKPNTSSTQGKAEKSSKKESKADISLASRDSHNEKHASEHGAGNKTAVLEHKEFAIFSDNSPKPKGPLPQSQFICQLCQEVYTDPFSLAQHKCSGIQHTEHRCPECDKVFSCPANLASHRRWHRPRSPPHEKKSTQAPPPKPVEIKRESDGDTDVDQKNSSPPMESERSASPVSNSQGQFVCTVCSKTFRRKAYLRKHMNNHTDDRPYPCQYCGKVFRSLTNRAKHVLNHAVGPKTFTCNVCGNGFANKGGLDRHSRIHTGEIYSCKQCSSTFYSSPGLTRHINKCHPPENRQIVVLQVPVRQG